MTECPSEKENQHTTPNTGPYYLDHELNSDDPGVPDKVYCGNNGCDDGSTCPVSQTEKPYPGNPVPRDNKPDVVAPVHYPIEYSNSGTFDIAHGTSYAAPIVAGTIAEAYGKLLNDGNAIPKPPKIRELVRENTVPLDEGGAKKLNAFGLRQSLMDLPKGSDAQH